MTIFTTYKHSFRLFIKSEQEWKTIAKEDTTPLQLFLSLLLPLLIVMAICIFMGYQMFTIDPVLHIQMHLFSAGATFLLSVLSILVSSWLISKFAHFDEKTERFNKAFILVSYSFIPGIIFNSLAFLFPMVNYLTILSLLSFYFLYKGIAPMLNIPVEKKSGHFTFILIGLLSVYAVLGAFFIGFASYLGF